MQSAESRTYEWRQRPKTSTSTRSGRHVLQIDCSEKKAALSLAHGGVACNAMHLCVVRSRSAWHSQIIYPHMMSVQCGNAHHHYALSSSSTTLTFPIHVHTHCYARTTLTSTTSIEPTFVCMHVRCTSTTMPFCSWSTLNSSVRAAVDPCVLVC